MLQLREYQEDLAKRASQALKRSGSVVVQLETGAGKTHIAARMSRSWVRQNKRIWFIAHRQEILAQARRVFAEAGLSGNRRIEFKMIAAAVKASKQETAPDVLVFDECHHAPAKTWAGVIGAAPSALRVGLTATPGRLDGAPLSDFFAEIVHGPSPKALREAGHLARYRYFAPVVPDLSGVRVRKGEYDRSQAEKVMMGATIVGDVVDHYKRHADGKRAILFAVSVDASRDMAARFCAAGVPARHVDGQSPEKERVEAIEAIRRGRVKVLCSVDLFTEGFDLPAIDAVILLRPTRSLALFRQMLGRGARPSGRNKTVILDHAACVAEHGLPDEEYEWTLDGKPPRQKTEIEGGKKTRLRRCPGCNTVHLWADECVDCGHEYTGARGLTEVGGELEEFLRPSGHITLAEYSRLRGVSRSAPFGWVKSGMPTNLGFVDPIIADQWLFQRNEKTRIMKAKMMRETWENPEKRANIIDKVKKNMSIPSRKAHLSELMKRNKIDPEFLKKEAAGKKLRSSSAEGRAHIFRISKLGKKARYG